MLLFAADERGSVAVVFAIVLVALVGSAGIAIDLSRAHQEHRKAQDALDAAVLSAIGEETTENAQAKFAGFLQANVVPAAGATFNRLTVANGFEGTANLKFPVATSFMTLFGYDKIDVDVTSVAFTPNIVSEFTITLNQAFGWSDKAIEYIVQRPDGSEEVLATVAYHLTDTTGANSRGTGITTFSPSQTISVGAFKKIWMRMTVTDYATGMPTTYTFVDGADANRVFIDSVALADSAGRSTAELFPCSRTAQIEVEDTDRPVGDQEWNTHDMSISVASKCENPSAVAHLIR